MGARFFATQYADEIDGRLQGTGETFRLPADQVFRAIGQSLVSGLGLDMAGSKIATSETGRTSLDKVWAGGDCTPGEDLTVVAVSEGRDAAEDIHAALTGA